MKIIMADLKYCKTGEKENEFIKLKVTQNITFPKARKLVEASLIKGKKIEELLNLINDLQNLIKTNIHNIEKIPTTKANKNTNSHRSISRRKEKEENQKSIQNFPIETKNKFKNLEQMEIESLNTCDARYENKKHQNLPNKTAGTQIIWWNIRGIRSNLEELHLLMNTTPVLYAPRKSF